uniref:DNA-(apurinic or apyrimidinic site) endonuclease n=1 Tax=Chlamydomonas leiostraca TaxID=1034604 RepID=A0A7S0WNY8_9CHLO|mmetsp:Transcript_21338/g.54325  ORF Transcript_21338/g.54325 Transcript_21338/m.54325 type:complete len:498 (+) Transcript_21338:1215-2708(+)|eukprot:CAMPEP_0202864306 /NCGR_PEP_ID=MMETSP1391-20130828/4594_1 /ASSEMBLY_ACC=CAM_ASM_000867 /TAXON_ID=1034604 /ORGANISM="Chlamydomonas leiostraca, Strain SAG 11-49" /LENGTH=497 /DNA_ID=CAMNT_0049544041 /DNA_START=1211 /DNA_END=2704 /DNA_ORIENTATION=-
MDGSAEKPLPVGSDGPGETFRLMCWNINGLAPTLPNIKLSKHKSLEGFFRDYQLSACCWQEIKLPEAKVTKEMACVPGYESFWATSRARLGYSGCTTWVVSPAWSPVSAQADCLGGGAEDIDQEGRVVITDCGAFVLLNVYAPNAGDHPERPRLAFKLRFLQALLEKMQQLSGSGQEVVLVGDLNIAAAAADVHPSFSFDGMYAAEELRLLHELMASYPDVWRKLHPEDTGCYTVWEERTNARAFNRGCRIDYVCVSPGLLPHVTSCEILTDLPPKWSDHAPLLLELRGLAPPAPHPPCPLSSSRNTRFNDPKQPSILAALRGSKQQGPGSSKAGKAGQTASKTAPAAAATLVAPERQPATGTVAAGTSSRPSPAQVTEGKEGQSAAASVAEGASMQLGSVQGEGSSQQGHQELGEDQGGKGCTTQEAPQEAGVSTQPPVPAAAAAGINKPGPSGTSASGPGGAGSKAGGKRGAAASKDEKAAKSQKSIKSFFGKKG